MATWRLNFFSLLGSTRENRSASSLRAEGADPVVGIAAQQCLTPTMGLDDFVKPEVQGIVQIHIGQDG